MIRYAESVLGAVRIECDGEYITGITFSDKSEEKEATCEILDCACREVEEYLTGCLREFSVPFKSEGTEFERKVLAEICRIPYGETCSYSQIAENVGSPGASRAVGSVCSRNKILLIVPCHRVVRSDGNVHGYSGGNERKQFLLDMEKRISKAERE